MHKVIQSLISNNFHCIGLCSDLSVDSLKNKSYRNGVTKSFSDDKGWGNSKQLVKGYKLSAIKWIKSESKNLKI